MNNIKKKNKNTSSYLLFIGAVSFMAAYMYVSKDNYKYERVAETGQEVINSPAKLNETPAKIVVNEEKNIEDKKLENEVSDQEVAELDVALDDQLPSVSSFMSNPEPMVKKIHQLTIVITRRHETRITDVLKNDNKEELFSKYIQLKNERGAKFFEQIKIDNSRITNQRINSEYQTKLLDVFGQETFTKYRSVLKQSNVEARAYNIILDF